MPVSEVAQLRERIANEYRAAKWGLSGLAYGTPKHQFITARMEHIEESRETLAACVGHEQAMSIVAETLVSIPDNPQRDAVLEVIKHVMGTTEKTAQLIDAIRGAWETIDLLVQEFGQEDAHTIIMTPRDSFSSERS
ncbi:MAG: hypothetical protein M3Z08_09605 [Chloroflexota bacterium]|nr:hypothetical protein [Chloroflexota bacterium]